MSEKTTPDRHKDSHLVQFWVKKHLLTKWDDFCEQYSMNRTAFIIQACNAYMLENSDKGIASIDESKLKVEIASLQDKIDTIVTKMDKREVENVDPRVRARVSNYLTKHPASDVEDFNDIIGLSREGLLDLLEGMKADKIVICDKNGRWSLK